MSLISLKTLSIAFGDRMLLDAANLEINKGQRIGLIGRNGEGKSTLLRIINGEQPPDEGELLVKPGIKIAMLAQSAVVAENCTVYEVVAAAMGDAGKLLMEYQNLLEHHDFSQPSQALEAVQNALENQGGWSLNTRIEKTLSRLNLNAKALYCALSGGWQRRALLARTLVNQPDIILLDEPTNHLDIPAIAWLEKHLIGFRGALLFITHDREFLQNIATDIVELDRGKLTQWAGTYGDYLRRKAAALEEEVRHTRKHDKKLALEESWIRQGIKARRTRNEGRVRALQKLRLQQQERRKAGGKVKLALHQGHLSGKIILEATRLNYAIAGTTIVKDFSATILRGDRIGLIGENGCGKTTLIRLLLGELQAISGKLRQGTRLETAYFDQTRQHLDPDMSVIDAVGRGREQITIGDKSKHIMSYLADFLFSPARVRSPIKSLSGGERARVLLARIFAQPINLLVMDEPTNDLDIETLELLEELLLDFSGTLLLVSHDRKFIDNVVTSTWVFEGGGEIKEYVGGYADWLRQTSTEIAAPPHKIGNTSESGKKSESRQVQTSKARKLSYNLQRELDAIPDKINQLERNQFDLTARVSAADFYQSEPAEITRTLDKIKSVETELAKLYARWGEIEG